jgi:hypothetical protein
MPAFVRCLVLFFFMLASMPTHAETPADTTPEPEARADVKLQTTVENLSSIQQSIDANKKTVRELREQLKILEDTAERVDIEQKIERLNKDISNLQRAFNHIALNGISASALTEQPDIRINWKDEVEQISRPLLSTLKELTAKPRELDSLRREIELREDQLEIIEKALNYLRAIKTQTIPPGTVEPVDKLLTDWEQRKIETQRALDIAQYKQNNLMTETVSWYKSIGTATSEFLRGRGLTLLLAAVISIIIWLVGRGLLWLYWRWLYRSRDDSGVKRAPLVLYSYRLTVAILIVMAILMVFYLRGDLLLLTLAVIALVGAALSLRQTLPRYAAELRLLLGVGPVREQERLSLDGVPYLVESLSIYSVLRNPQLDGVVRLPLHDMNDYASRPAGIEPWFPCKPGDFILLDNGNLGKVVKQTIEIVEIVVLDSILQIRTKDFLDRNIRNLTREGFGIACSFGIDYQHQAICLDTVPQRFREGIVNRFERAGLKKDIRDILVEFDSAGSSSLDYRIYLTLDGRAASAFFKIQRLVQQACVEVCNREGWVIPFTQITVHSANDADEADKTDNDGRRMKPTL